MKGQRGEGGAQKQRWRERDCLFRNFKAQAATQTLEAEVCLPGGWVREYNSGKERGSTLGRGGVLLWEMVDSGCRDEEKCRVRE